MTVTLPDNFDVKGFDQQINEWIKEKLDYDAIVSKAKQRWPQVSKEYVEASYRLIKRLLHLEEPVPVTLEKDLFHLYRKRARRIRKLEAVLDAGDAPASMHTLYRGLLRDQESLTLKMIAIVRQERLDHEKQEREAQQETVNDAQMPPSVSDRTTAPSPDDNGHVKGTAEPPPAPPRQSAGAAGIRSLCLLIGFFLALLMIGCVSSTSRLSPPPYTPVRRLALCPCPQPGAAATCESLTTPTQVAAGSSFEPFHFIYQVMAKTRKQHEVRSSG